MVRSDRQRCRFTLRGVDVGAGLRPFVARAAETLSLSGFCKRQDLDVLVIEVEGEGRSVREFRRLLMSEGPSARVREWMVRPLGPTRQRGFSVSERPTHAPRAGDVNVGLLPCLGCPRGPLAAQPLLDDESGQPCAQEERPCHALRLGAGVAERSCPLTGTTSWLESAFHSTLARGPESVLEAVDLLLAGGTVSIKGPHGYHLVADATARHALARLRTWKDREREPFAVLFPDLGAAREVVAIGAHEADALRSQTAPIVLLRRHDDFAARVLAENVAPGRQRLGVVLASTPFQYALAAGVGRPLVLTRANDPAGRTIETDEQARRTLDVVDAHLMHDGPCGDGRDTSVLQFVGERRMTIVRARGLAERSFPLETRGRVVLALGSSCAYALGSAAEGRAWLWPAVPHTPQESVVSWAERMAQRYGGERRPTTIAYDAGCSCAVTLEAERLADVFAAARVPVSHAEAHVAAVCLEHGVRGPVHALLLDDGGPAPDGSSWGGEVLHGQPGRMVRVAHLRPFHVPRSEPCTRDPRLSAVSVLHALDSRRAEAVARELLGADAGRELVAALAAGRDVQLTTSAGILFEAMAALLLEARRPAYELEPLWALTDAFERAPGVGTVAVEDDGETEIDWRPLVRELLAEHAAGAGADGLVARFHRGLLAPLAARARGADPVVLCGSVLRSPAVVAVLEELFAGRVLVIPECVPPGDQGLALGQLALAVGPP